ncbi:MAG: LysM domain-containing protein [Gammaproteobacteria bacterium]|nr:LysM domain-containing protein [Gammaproteobacteria bacterium]NNJ90697.1 LysM peptidoglycan-binding domain-containing protein [Gammaproteobacteria bacterium]
MKKIVNRKVSGIAAGVLLAITSANISAYEIQRGDTLFEIAESMGVPMSVLLQANPQITNPDAIEVGTRLNMPGGASPEAAYKMALKSANAALDKAASVGGEWRDSRWKKSKYVKWKNPAGKTVKGSYVGIAKMAAEAGDYKKAVKLLKVAKKQGDLGYAQAMQQKNAGPMIGSSAPKQDETEKLSYDELLKATMEAADKAASVGGEWRDLRWKKSKYVKWTKPDGSTVKGSYVDIAKMAAAAGDYEKAKSLLKTAKFQAEMGYQQAMGQKDAKPML